MESETEIKLTQAGFKNLILVTEGRLAVIYSAVFDPAHSPASPSSHSLDASSLSLGLMSDQTSLPLSPRSATESPVIVKVLQPEITTQYLESQLRNEYNTGKKLFDAGAQVVEPHLFEKRGLLAMYWADEGAVPVSHRKEFLEDAGQTFTALAVRILEAVISCHRSNLVHCDLKPKNILVTPAGKISIIDFRMSFFWRPHRIPPIRSVGTAAFISPEATGLVQLPIDQRSDVYSLGCTFYTLLSNTSIFPDSENSNLMCSHLSQRAPNIRTVDARVPRMVAAIIAKMVEKSPEDRYQSMSGVLNDLRRAQQGVISDSSLTSENFILGRKDFVMFPLAPPHLVGRKTELAMMAVALESAWSSRTSVGFVESPLALKTISSVQRGIAAAVHVLSVSGLSGSGKTMLCTESVRAFKQKSNRGDSVIVFGGKFVVGIPGERPFGAVCDALDDLIMNSLKKTPPSEMIESIRTHVTEAAVLEALFHLSPKLEELFSEAAAGVGLSSRNVSRRAMNRIGSQQTLESMITTTVKSREGDVYLGIVGLLAALTPEGGMLVMVLDDMQWAGSDTTRLLEKICFESRLSLAVVALHRQNEVSPTHVWRLALDRMEEGECPVTAVDLAALDKEATKDLISSCLSCHSAGAANIEEFGETVWVRTSGNPFLIVEFVSLCCLEGHLHFDVQREQWKYDAVTGSAWSDTCVDIVALGLQSKESQVVKLLGLAACFRNQMDCDLLATVSGETVEAMEDFLSSCVVQGYMFRVRDTDDGSPPGVGVVKPCPLRGTEKAMYQFVHDKIATAAYSLIGEKERKSVHSAIGERLLSLWPQRLPGAIGTVQLFQVLFQLNRGNPVTSTEERWERVGLNVEAARRSWASASESATIHYTAAALALIGEEEDFPKDSETALEVTVELELLRALALKASGDLDGAEAVVTKTLPKATVLRDRVALMRVMFAVHKNRGNDNVAVEYGLSICSALGFLIPPMPSQTQFDEESDALIEIFEKDGVNICLGLPDSRRWQSSVAMSVMIDMLPHAEFSRQKCLHSLLPVRAVSLLLQDGSTPSGGEALSALGYVLFTSRSFGETHVQELCRVGVALARIHGQRDCIGRALIFQGLVSAITQQMSEGTDLFLEAFTYLNSSGDQTWAGLAISYEASFAMMAGERLSRGLIRLRRYKEDVETRLAALGMSIVIYVNEYAANILVAENQKSVSEVAKEAGHSIAKYKSAEPLWRIPSLCLMAKVHYIMKHGAIAQRCLEECAEIIDHVSKNLAITFEYSFWAGMVWMRERREQFRGGEWDESEVWKQRKEIVERSRQHLKTLATVFAPNYEIRHLLLEAEYKWTKGGARIEILVMLEEVMAKALAANASDLAAIAAEEARSVSLDLKLEVGSEGYKLLAIAHYGSWGAHAKCYSMDSSERPDVKEASQDKINTTTHVVFNSAVATLTQQMEILFRMSEMTMRETDPSRLVQISNQLLVEASGATHGYLFLSEEDTNIPAGELVLVSKWEGRSVYNYELFKSKDKRVSIPLAPRLSSLAGVLSRRIIERVQSTRLMEYLANASVAAADDPEDAFLQSQGQSLRSVLVMPWSRGGTLGVIYLENRLIPGAFIPSVRNLLQLIAAHFAVVLENVFLIDRVQAQLSMAKTTNTKLREMAALKDQLLANVSHELRTPINGIVGACELIINSVLDSDQIFLTKTIEACSSGMMLVVEDILTNTQLKNKSLLVVLDDISLDVLLHTISHIVACMADQNSLDFYTSLETSDTGGDLVVTDKKVLQQILLNLMSNAVKFTSSTVGGSVGLIVRCRDGGVAFEVVDTGIGMSPETLSNIFQPFYQGDMSHKRKYSGTGLGLSICEQLLQLLNSGTKITVESSIGIGSKFSFWLPSGVTLVGGGLKEIGSVSYPTAIVMSSSEGTSKSLRCDLHLIGWQRILKIDGADTTGAITLLRQASPDEKWVVFVDILPLVDAVQKSVMRSAMIIKALIACGRARTTVLFHLCAAGSMQDVKKRLERLLKNEHHEMCKFGHKPFFGSDVRDATEKMWSDFTSETSPGRFKNSTVCTTPRPKSNDTILDFPGSPSSLPSAPRLAASSVAAASPTAGSEKKASPTTPAGSLIGSKFLVVDDNKVNLLVLERTLRFNGAIVTTATDGLIALEKLAVPDEIFDLVFMDCQMPVMDGYEATRKYRQREATEGLRHTHILACTAGALANEIEACYTAGMCGVVLKPITATFLLQTIKDGKYPRCSAL